MVEWIEWSTVFISKASGLSTSSDDNWRWSLGDQLSGSAGCRSSSRSTRSAQDCRVRTQLRNPIGCWRANHVVQQIHIRDQPPPKKKTAFPWGKQHIFFFRKSCLWRICQCPKNCSKKHCCEQWTLGACLGQPFRDSSPWTCLRTMVGPSTPNKMMMFQCQYFRQDLWFARRSFRTTLGGSFVMVLNASCHLLHLSFPGVFRNPQT